jgi:hypothetical protein
MASPDNHSQEPLSPPAIPTHSTISRVYAFEVPQPTIEQDGDSPAQPSFDATVSLPLFRSHTTLIPNPRPPLLVTNLFEIEPAGFINICRILILEPSTTVSQTS